MTDIQFLGVYDEGFGANAGANYVYFHQTEASLSGKCTKIKLKCGTDIISVAKVAIYSDNNNMVGSLIGATGEFSISIGTNEAGISVDLVSGVKYWIGYIGPTVIRLRAVSTSCYQGGKSESYSGYTFPDTITGLSYFSDQKQLLISGWGTPGGAGRLIGGKSRLIGGPSPLIGGPSPLIG